MNRRRHSVLILVTALLIIGMRGVCAAQFSQHASVDKADTQEWNDVQASHPVNERIRGGFVFRVKRYIYVAPAAREVFFQDYRITQDLHVNPAKSCKSCKTEFSCKDSPGIKQ